MSFSSLTTRFLVSCSSLLVALCSFGIDSKPAHAIIVIPTQVIYDSQFKNGWQDWSWAQTNDFNTLPTYNSLPSSISVSDANPGNFGALWLHPSALVNTNGIYSVSFWINGGPTGGQTLQVTGVIGNNTPGTWVQLPTPIQANTWVFESIPLSAMGVSNISNLNGIWIQNATPNPMPAFFVNDVTLNPSPTVIYDNQLEGNWQDYSWLTVNQANTSPTFNGSSDSIAATDNNPGGFGGLAFHSATTFDSSPYQSVTFWINGGPTGGQSLNIEAFSNIGGNPLDGYTNGSIPLPNPVQANTWVQETVPLSALGVANDQFFDEVAIQSTIGGPSPTFYVGGVQLDAGPPVSGPGAQSAIVSINPSNTIGTVPPTPVGVNTAVWDSLLTDPPVNPLLTAAGMRMLRYPAGSDSDSYNWETNSNIGIPVEGTGSFQWQSDATFDSFIQNVAQQVGAVPIITTNYGSNENGTAGGDPALAAAWVYYANVTHNYGVKYWEIGNEIYGNGYYAPYWDWETDLHLNDGNPNDRVGASALSPTSYGQNVVTYANAMKAVDPTIKIGVVLQLPGQGPGTPSGSLQDWDSNVLQQCGSKIDFVILHWYPQFGTDNDSVLLSDPAQIASFVSGTKTLISQYCGANAPNVQILTDETNSDSSAPGKQMMSNVQALFMADNIQSWLEGGVYNVDYWDLHNDISFGDLNSSLFGNFTYGDEGMLSNGSSNGGISEPPAETPFATYYALLMLHDLANPGDTMLHSYSNQPLLISHAVAQANGNTAIMLENEDPNNAYTASVSVSGRSVPALGNTVFTYGPSNSSVVQNTIYTNDNNVGVTIPPYGMATLILPPPPPPTGAPTISPNGGTTVGPVQVTLSVPSNQETIKYTTDGSNPATNPAAITYSTPFTLTSSATVNAVANQFGFSTSSITTAAFTINGPVVTNTSISPANLAVTGGAITVSATVTDSSTLTSVKASIIRNGTTVSNLSLTNGGSGNVYTANYNAPANITGTAYTFTSVVTAHDTSGYSSIVPVTGSSVEASDTAPSIGASIGPANLPIAGGLISVTANVTGSSAISSVRASIINNGTTVTTITLSNGGSGSVYSGTFNASPNTTGTTNTFTSNVTAKDVAGISGSSLASGTVVQASDLAPAVSGSISPASILTSGGVITVSATVTGTLPISSVRATIVKNGTTVMTITLSNGGSGSSYTGTYNAPANTSGVTNTFTSVVTAKDTLGVTGSASASGSSVQLADSAPAINATITPANLATGGGAVTVTATVTGSSAIGSVRATIVKNGTLVTTLNLSNGGSGNVYTASYNASPNVSGSTNTFTSVVTAKDAAALTSSAAATGSSVQSPDVAPTIVASIGPATLPKAGGVLTVTANVTGTTAIGSVRATIIKNGVTYTTITLSNGGSGSVYTGNFTVSPSNTQVTFTSSVTAKDAVGLTGTASASGSTVED